MPCNKDVISILFSLLHFNFFGTIHFLAGLKLVEGHQGSDTYPFVWPQCPSQKSLFDLGLFCALSKYSYLCCNKRMCPRKKLLCPKFPNLGLKLWISLMKIYICKIWKDLDTNQCKESGNQDNVCKFIIIIFIITLCQLKVSEKLVKMALSMLNFMFRCIDLLFPLPS